MICRPSRGIEPLSGDPQSPILATVLRRPQRSHDFEATINLTVDLAKKIRTKFIILYTKTPIMQGKGWFIAMAITIAVVWWGVNYLFPWQH